MKTKRYVKCVIAALAVSGMCWQAIAVAAENVQPRYTDAAAADHAAYMARQAASSTDPSLQAALADVHTAETQMARMQASGNKTRMMAAETHLNTAEDRYAGMLSQMTGVSEKEIGDMRAAGVSWSEIAGELGMQMGTGMGSGNMSQGNMGGSRMGSTGAMQGNRDDVNSMMGSRAAEIMDATARNPESGWAEGHGSGMAPGKSGTGSGGMMSRAAGLSNDMGGSGSSGMRGGNGMDSGGGMGGSSSGGMGGGMGGSDNSSGGGGAGGGGGMM